MTRISPLQVSEERPQLVPASAMATILTGYSNSIAMTKQGFWN
jgi:hypothetical protein